MSARVTRPVVLTGRDRQIVNAAWSLGYAPARTLHQLLARDTSERTFGQRLRVLLGARYLVRRTFVAPTGGLWLYGRGRTGVAVGAPAPWRPSLSQLEHTLAVGEAVVALTRPGFGAGLAVTGWQGEAELRAWAAPAAPYPDARITWSRAGVTGGWLVEVDRATESRAAWRRKLVRYLTAGSPEPVLVLTTSLTRASNLALVAADLGVAVLATTMAATQAEQDPWVLDSSTLRRTRLSRA